ncbi:MAG: acetyl-CoA hydrolase/transferase C-terminal domain-containing protein [Candidatus Limnocylindrales bacterium]
MQLVTAAEAVAGITSGQQLYVHSAASTPSVLLDALVARAPELTDVKILHFHAEGPGPHLAPEMAGHFRHRALFIGPNARAAVNEGRAEYIPVFLSDVPTLIRRGILPIDAVLVNVSPPDRHGFCSLGTSVLAMPTAIRHATTVIAQINAAMPRTLGDSFVHVDDIDFGVEVEQPPYAIAAPTVGEIEQRIGQFVADLVPHGATIQMGIGAIPTAVASALHDKRDLGVHTEMMTDGVVELVEAGAVTGKAKEINAGHVVATFMLGSQRLYDWAHDNPMVEMRPTEYTNDTAVIRRFKKMVAINSAIEVDVTGQVCADSIGSKMYSGVGGQMDFIRGAALADDGRAIICLPSTTGDGKISRIVPYLRQGAGVVTTRAHVETIITEHGVAEMHGRSIPERVRQLIAIAHPSFRDELTFEARKNHWV